MLERGASASGDVEQLEGREPSVDAVRPREKLYVSARGMDAVKPTNGSLSRTCANTTST